MVLTSPGAPAERCVLGELNLYLDTHPADAEAISLYNTMVKKAAALRDEYERGFGMLTPGRASGSVPWQWIDNPWPWQNSFNFELTGEPV